MPTSFKRTLRILATLFVAVLVGACSTGTLTPTQVDVSLQTQSTPTVVPSQPAQNFYFESKAWCSYMPQADAVCETEVMEITVTSDKPFIMAVYVSGVAQNITVATSVYVAYVSFEYAVTDNVTFQVNSNNCTTVSTPKLPEFGKSLNEKGALSCTH